MTSKLRLRSPLKIVAIAAIAGLVAGAVAVYVSNRPSGNNEQLADSCNGKAEFARKVGDAAIGAVAAMMAAEPQSLSSLKFQAPDERQLTIADFRGKTLLLNLWATWCAPCRAEMPELDSLQREKGGENFEVVAVNVDKGDDSKPKAFLTEIGVTNLAFYRDNTLGIFNELKARALALGLPVTLLIDEEGCLLAHMNGPAEWGSDDAKRLIETATAGANRI